MTTPTIAPSPAPSPAMASMRDPAEPGSEGAVAAGRIVGLRCRACGGAVPTGPSFVCGSCLGPLEVEYDLAAVAASVTRDGIASRPAGIWRYLELLPVEAPPPVSLPVGSTPLIDSPWLARELGVRRAWLKDDTRNPSLSFKDRGTALGAARAVDFGFEALACASTGNLAGAVAAAAAAAGLPAYVFIPSDLERAKVEHALAYGATVVPVDGTYDDVNRLCLELADELPWAFVNINLRPYYAEGSRTLAFEIAEALGWRAPDVVVAPIASGALYTKLARGFRDLAAAGLIEARPVRHVGAQAIGCAPVGAAFDAGADRVSPVRTPDTFVRSLAIGSPADGDAALALARESGGSVESVPDTETAAAIRTLARRSGMFAETAGGVTLAAAFHALRRGVLRPDDEVVILVTGNGLKTPDARLTGLPAEAPPARPGVPGLAPVVRPSLAAVETWLESVA